MKEQTKIIITIGETVVTGTLNDSKSSKDLISLITTNADNGGLPEH